MKKILFATIAIVGMMLSSCDDYLDINTNPNNPSESELGADLILPAVEMNVAASYGDYLRFVGGYFAQHYSQMFGTSNFLAYSRFQIAANSSSGMVYTQLYQRAISNAETVRNLAKSSEEWGTYLAATVLRAVSFAALVDCYGETPYTETLSNVTQPAFDDGRTVYDGILAELDEALAKVSSSDAVATNFLYPNEDATKWIRFANALKLKLYMRIANVDDSVLSEVKTLIDEDNFPTEDVAWTSCWGPSAGEENPYYAEEFATNFGSTQTNVIANVAIVNTMKQASYTDPRLAAFFEVNNEGGYRGGVSGTNFSTAAGTLSDGSWNRPKMAYDSPLSLISLAEVEFFKAEYYARSSNSTKAAEAYANAVAASFASAGVQGADACVAQYPYDQSNWKESIGMAKWVALSGVDNFEAWCELRRLGYPEFSDISGANIFNGSDYDDSVYVPGTLYTPIQVYSPVGSKQVVQRFPYAEAATTRNANTPEQDESLYKTPVFWAE